MDSYPEKEVSLGPFWLLSSVFLSCEVLNVMFLKLSDERIEGGREVTFYLFFILNTRWFLHLKRTTIPGRCEQKESGCDRHDAKHLSVACCSVLENELHPAKQCLSCLMCHFLCLKKTNIEEQAAEGRKLLIPLLAVGPKLSVLGF